MKVTARLHSSAAAERLKAHAWHQGVVIVSSGNLEVPSERAGGTPEVDFRVGREIARKVKVAVVSPYYRNYSGRRMVGEKMEVVEVRFPAVRNYPFNPAGIAYLASRLVYGALAAISLVRLKRRGYGVVVVDDKLTGLLPIAVSKLMKIPSIYSEGNNYPWYLPRFMGSPGRTSRVYNQSLAKLAAALADRVRAQSNLIRTGMVMAGIPPDKIVVIPAGVDTVSFEPAGPNYGTFTIGYVGRLSKEKGLPLLIQLLEQSALELPGVEFVVLGGGKDGPRISAMPNVRFCGIVPRGNLPTMMAGVSLFVFFQPEFGLGELEALSCAKPIITLRGLDTRGYVEDGVNGILVGPKVAEYISAIRSLANEPDRMKKMGENARRTAVEKFDWRTIGEMWTALVEDLLPFPTEVREGISWPVPEPKTALVDPFNLSKSPTSIRCAEPLLDFPGSRQIDDLDLRTNASCLRYE